MSRNILNTWDVDRFLGELCYPDGDRVIRRWLDRVARRWILKEFHAAGRVVRARRKEGVAFGEVDVRWAEAADSTGETARASHLPDWLDAALPRGVHWLDMAGPSARELGARLGAVVDYFRGLRDSPRYNRVERMSLPAAIELAARFRDKGACDGGTRDNTLMTFKNGFRIALLTGAKDLETEGERMRHCVGDYAEDLKRGLDILSLRDARDRPHVTMEVQGGRWVHQIKGKANGQVAERYRPYVLAFFKALDLRIKGDRELIGVTKRSFDALAPEGWRHEPTLATTIRNEITGRPHNAGEIDTFYADVQTAVGTMPDDTWEWFVDLFRGPAESFVWLEPVRCYEIARERFFLVEVRFPFRLYWALSGHRDQRSRRLRRRVLDDLTAIVFNFCRQDDSTLVDPGGHEHVLDIDVRRLRHAHLERLRRRLAGARRGMRRAAEGARQPYVLLDRWERDRRHLARRLDEESRSYL